jgi:dihydrofolate synthase/folylpolyglutamate synthase
MYQRIGQAAYKADLKNTIELMCHLDNPETRFKSIHVAGTNGKGSVSHMLASVLQEAGYKVGLYTSPHLKDFRERIKIDGKPIPEEEVIRFVELNTSFFESHQVSFFEMTVGMAFQYFAAQQVAIAVVEVGMGGRLDSTNVIFPEVAVITNIGLDHTQFLGNTLPEIAFEKAGIIKRGKPVVIGETQSETKAVFLQKAKENNSEIYFADTENYPSYQLDLKGIYQQKNLKTVLKTIEVLKRNFPVSQGAIEKGLQNVIDNTGLMGRWQQLRQNPKVICDTAHNKEGLRYVMQQLSGEQFEKLHIVFGVVSDKDLEQVLPLFPKNARYYFCKPDIPRGMDASVLRQQAVGFGLFGDVYTSVAKAYESALKAANERDMIFVGGSTFVVAEII